MAACEGCRMLPNSFFVQGLGDNGAEHMRWKGLTALHSSG